MRPGPSISYKCRHVLASAEGSLRRLGTDYLDVYLVHRLEMYYSLVGRDLEHEVVPFALDAGVSPAST